MGLQVVKSLHLGQRTTNDSSSSLDAKGEEE